VAGLGTGLVISPNITISLSEVPLTRAGSAGGVLQTAQRIGSAVGIAAVGSFFFATLADARGDWTGAVTGAVRLCTVVVVLALVVALFDLWTVRRGRTRPFGAH
jgi:cyanate permease